MEDKFDDLVKEHGAVLQIGKFTLVGWPATIALCTVPTVLSVILFFLL